MDMVECVARALFQRDVDEDVCDGTWEDNVAIHDRILADSRAAIAAMRELTLDLIEAGAAEEWRMIQSVAAPKPWADVHDLAKPPLRTQARSVFQRMIDVALKDGE